MQIYLDMSDVYDWQDFHSKSFQAFQFSGFYDHSMESWIDAMKDMLNEDDDGCGIYLADDESVQVMLEGCEMVISQCPEVMLGLMEAVALVNQHFADEGSDSRLLILAS